MPAFFGTKRILRSENRNSLILDRIPNAGAAYSLRKLRSTYTGPAIRVRRTGDNSVQDIGFAGTELDTSALLAFIGGNSGFVVTWYDQSGNSRDITQAATANQPRIVNAGTLDIKNTKPSLFFNGTTMWLANSTPFMYDAGSNTAYVVASGNTSQTSRFLLIEVHSTNSQPVYAPMTTDASSTNTMTKLIRNDANTVLSATGTGTLTAFDGELKVYGFKDTGSELSSYINGTVDLNAEAYTRSGTLTMNRFGIGAVVRDAPASRFAGFFSEVIVHPSVLSDTNRQSIERDQKRYFGTP